MDDELLLKSLLYVADSLEDLLGPKGARVMLRAAGRKAAANLIDGLPLHLPAAEAVARSADLLVELGFAKAGRVHDKGQVRLSGLAITRTRDEMGRSIDGAGRYFCVGLLEGFSRQISGRPVQVPRCKLEGQDEQWKVQV
jgi:hypothetical protein